MSKPVLTYFNARGRAELIRLCFAAADADYEDVRFSREEFPEFQKSGKSPTGQVPLLEIDGLVLVQSMAIVRYLAHKYGLYGGSDADAVKIDMISDTITDVVTKMMAVHFEKDEARKTEMQTDFATSILPRFGPIIVKWVEDNPSGFFVGDKLSFVDLQSMLVFDLLPPPLQAGFPKLKEHRDKVAALPRISAWLAKRPETPM
eukprot:TRINITY_DN7919_c0_g1_i1.p1 TRINITY_DN7919_c0_g1~~TRINITY_DN7919_c0_g1_i1.p1  ORF type:complete len:203 (+),score=39.80 TRINITY_DN7919_c0_g1_i1:53-661(+)